MPSRQRVGPLLMLHVHVLVLFVVVVFIYFVYPHFCSILFNLVVCWRRITKKPKTKPAVMSRKENLLYELHTKKGTWKIVVRITDMWRVNKHNGRQSIEMVLMDHTVI
ncbi:hypothetical protein AAZX31_04G166300 [Glycine max]